MAYKKISDLDVASVLDGTEEVPASQGNKTVKVKASDLGVALSDTPPQPLGTPTEGTSTDASRADHVHDMPSATDVGAVDAAGDTTALWTGTQAEYDALPTATRNAAGFVVVIA